MLFRKNSANIRNYWYLKEPKLLAVFTFKSWNIRSSASLMNSIYVNVKYVVVVFRNLIYWYVKKNYVYIILWTHWNYIVVCVWKFDELSRENPKSLPKLFIQHVFILRLKYLHIIKKSASSFCYTLNLIRETFATKK